MMKSGLTGNFRLATGVGRTEFQPIDLGFEKVQMDQLSGGSTVEQSADIMYKILQREGTKAQTQAVLANAGAALLVANKAKTLQEGIVLAKESLESGRAFQAFKKFIMD